MHTHIHRYCFLFPYIVFLPTPIGQGGSCNERGQPKTVSSPPGGAQRTRGHQGFGTAAALGVVAESRCIIIANRWKIHAQPHKPSYSDYRTLACFCLYTLFSLPLYTTSPNSPWYSIPSCLPFHPSASFSITFCPVKLLCCPHRGSPNFFCCSPLCPPHCKPLSISPQTFLGFWYVFMCCCFTPHWL